MTTISKDVSQVVEKLTPNPRNIPAMFQIFHNVQFNLAQHKKYVKEMKKLYQKHDEDLFRESFQNALMYLFTFGDSSSNVDRTIKFVATFCTSLDDEEEFLVFIFEIIFKCQCVISQSVRFRASQLLSTVLEALGEDASLDDDVCDKLLTSQLERLQDARSAVRCRAALALQRLQNPAEPDDEVTRAYRFHMSCDPSPSVRRAVVLAIAKYSRNIPFVLTRLCDVDEAVRRAAFLYIAAMNVKQLKVKQRIMTLKVGLTEDSFRVRRVVEEILVPNWLSAFEGDVVQLLKAIRLDNARDAKESQDVAAKLLETLFKRLSVSELLEWLPTDKSDRLIPIDKLNKESVWYWRHLLEHLQRIDDDVTLESVLPNLFVLINYIKSVLAFPCPSIDQVDISIRQNVLQELIQMLQLYNISDTAGRHAIQEFIIDVFTGNHGPLSYEVIRVLMRALELAVPELAAREQIVCRVLNTIREPYDDEEPSSPVEAQPNIETNEIKMQRAKLRVSLNVAMEEQEEAVRKQNYSLAAHCKAKVDEIQKQLEELNVHVAPPEPLTPQPTIEKFNDVDALNKCLMIVNSFLDTTQINKIPPMIQLFVKYLEKETLEHPKVLENSLQTFAMFGMLDKQFAIEHQVFFFARLVVPMHEHNVVSITLKCLMDLLCVHGALLFEDEQADASSINSTKKRSTRHTMDTFDDCGSTLDSMTKLSPSQGTVIALLNRLMDGANESLRLIIVEGLCRLIYIGQLESPPILGRLLLLWFNPVNEDEDNLRQTLGVFFETFPVSVDGAQEQIQRATIPILRTLANAPSSSPLAEIDQEAVVRFIVSLTKVNHELVDSQGAMAQTLCSHLVRYPDASETALICRMLSLLSPPRDTTLAPGLANLLRDFCPKLTDKTSGRYLSRYLGALEVAERASLNKISNIEIPEGTLHNNLTDDTLLNIGRVTSSLPQPIARSTHVHINETVPEEINIDETSPTEVVSAITRISEEATKEAVAVSSSSKKPSSKKASSELSPSNGTSSENQSSNSNTSTDGAQGGVDSDSSGVSPVKKAKRTKGKKSNSSKKNAGRKTKKIADNKKAPETRDNEKGVKRTLSQSSLVDVAAVKAQSRTAEKQQEAPTTSAIKDLDSSNVTMRRSNKSKSGSDSNGSENTKAAKGKSKKKETKARRGAARLSSHREASPPLFDDSDDTLHTIVYESEMQQELLNDSDEPVNDVTTRRNVSIPETPDDSEESETESVKSKGR